ncbi:MAG: hypothetical protein PWP03_143 [Candidatus Woesearchaeota archaeon]|nr:hypothetical protein [Candidatus Woesearchaeota archaeon]MDN5327505.1 hypothetical protein [Candidatus Woesearchaeota archaeon]
MSLDELIDQRKKGILEKVSNILNENTVFNYGLIHFALSDLEYRLNKCKNDLKRNLPSVIDVSKKEELLRNIDTFVKYELYQALDELYIKIKSFNPDEFSSDEDIALFAIDYYHEIMNLSQQYEQKRLKLLQSNNPNKNYHPKSN